MNGHPPNRSGKGLRNASLNHQFIMTTSRNISWHKRNKETAGNNPAVSNFCVMDARLLSGVLSNVAGRVISGVFHVAGRPFNDVLYNFVVSVGGFGRLLTELDEGNQTAFSENHSKLDHIIRLP